MSKLILNVALEQFLRAELQCEEMNFTVGSFVTHECNSIHDVMLENEIANVGYSR
jgi:hypothetical protein